MVTERDRYDQRNLPESEQSCETRVWLGQYEWNRPDADEHPGMMFQKPGDRLGDKGHWVPIPKPNPVLGEFPMMKVQTPGGRWVPVEVVMQQYEVVPYVLIPLLGYSGLNALAESIRERIDRGFDCLIMVTGERGAGKSTLVLQTALAIDPKFSVDNVAFRIEEFSEIFARNKAGSEGYYPQVVMDEAGFSMHAQDWASRMQRTITKHMIISRIKRQIIWMTVPKRAQLNNQLRDMPYLWVDVRESMPFHKGYAEVLSAPGSLQSKWHPDRYWVHSFALFFPELKGALWDEYEKRKVDFVRGVTEDQGTPGIDDDLDESIRKMTEEGATQRVIAERLGIAHSTVSRRSHRKV